MGKFRNPGSPEFVLLREYRSAINGLEYRLRRLEDKITDILTVKEDTSEKVSIPLPVSIESVNTSHVVDATRGNK